MGVVALFLLGFAFAVYGPHVVRGGFTLDDWAFASDYERFGRGNGILHMARKFLESGNPARDPTAPLINAGGRPVAAFYFATTSAVFDSHTRLALAWVVVLAALMSVVAFAVLRTLGMERLHACAIAALILVFPAADAPRFWPAAAQSQLAIAMYGLGLLLALRGLRASGWSAIGLHGAALACFAVSLLHYEVAVGGIVLTIFAYRLRASWRPALVRWSADMATLAAVLLYLRTNKPYGFQPLGKQIDRARDIQGEARELFTYLGIQDGRTRLPLVVAIVLLLVAGGMALALPAGDGARKELRRWLGIAIAGVVAVGAGYLSFVPADSFYMPLRPGIGNRTNIAAAAGYSVVYYALGVLLALLAVRAVAGVRRGVRPVTWAAGGAAAVTVVVGALWVHEVARDRTNWDRAYRLDRETLNVLREKVPKPARGSTIYTFGVPGETAPLVYAFTTSWDLTGAVRLLWHDQSLHGIPSPSVEPSLPGNTRRHSGIRCGAHSAQPGGYLYSAPDASPYGKTIFVDVGSEGFQIVRSASECRAWVARLL